MTRSYQDEVRPDGTVIPGTRDCRGRWAAIATDITRHVPPEVGDRTGLDLGAHSGYFARRLHDDLGFTVTAIDDYPGNYAIDGVEVIARRVTADELFDLGPFDVTLALSVLHHVPDWLEMLDVLTAITTGVLYVETPEPHEVLPRAVSHCPELHAAVGALDGRPIAETAGYRSDILRTTWAVDCGDT